MARHSRAVRMAGLTERADRIPTRDGRTLGDLAAAVEDPDVLAFLRARADEYRSDDPHTSGTAAVWLYVALCAPDGPARSVPDLLTVADDYGLTWPTQTPA